MFLVALLALAVPAPRVLADEQPEAPISDLPPVRTPEITKVPDYPGLARRQRIEGEATVCFKVAPDGRVLEATVASSTHEIFEKPALEAIKGSTFEPLAPGEELVPSVCRTYRFRLAPAARKAVSSV